MIQPVFGLSCVWLFFMIPRVPPTSLAPHRPPRVVNNMHTNHAHAQRTGSVAAAAARVFRKRFRTLHDSLFEPEGQNRRSPPTRPHPQMSKKRGSVCLYVCVCVFVFVCVCVGWGEGLNCPKQHWNQRSGFQKKNSSAQWESQPKDKK